MMHLEVDHDTVTLYDKNKERVPCVYEAFIDMDVLTFDPNPNPNIRALERADLVRHWGEDDKPCPIKFQPEDTIFQKGPGLAVNDAQTETLFVGADLCGQWRIDSYIQSGSFGRGWIGMDADGEKVFIKTFRSYADRPDRGKRDRTQAVLDKQEAAIRKEIEVLLHPDFHKATDHPGVVRNMLCYGSVQVPKTKMSGDMFFIMSPDLCTGGELFYYLCPPTPPYLRSFTTNTARRLFRDVAEGVRHMHREGCYHRDLKLENLVVTGEFTVKIMDFGSAKFKDQLKTIENDYGEQQHIATTVSGVGTSGYKPAEARDGMCDNGYDPAKFDVWSCGVILFYLVVGEVVFAKLGGQQCFRFIERIALKQQYRDFLSPPGVIDDVTNAPPHTEMWKFLEDPGKEPFDEDLKVCINMMLDLDPIHRADMDTVCQCDYLMADDNDRTDFFKEMHARPESIQAGADLVGKKAIMMDKLKAPDVKSKRQLVIDSIPTADGGDMRIVVHDDEVDVGVNENGEPLYRIVFKDAEVNVFWMHGSLSQWLEFTISLKVTLGLE